MQQLSDRPSSFVFQYGTIILKSIHHNTLDVSVVLNGILTISNQKHQITNDW